MAELKIISMDEVPVEEVEWLWYPYIPFGKLTIIHGDGGEGKTTLILQLAALLSRGEKLPCDSTEREPIKVIYQTAEGRTRRHNQTPAARRQCGLLANQSHRRVGSNAYYA